MASVYFAEVEKIKEKIEKVGQGWVKENLNVWLKSLEFIFGHKGATESFSEECYEQGGVAEILM